MNLFKRARIIMLVALVAVIACAFIAGVVLLKADQDAAVAKYGAEVVNLCKAVSKTGSDPLPENARVVVINADLSTIADSYQKAVAADYQAQGKDDVTHVICMSSVKNTYDTSSYGNGKYTCTRYQQNYDIFVVEVKSGKTINYQQAEGTEPPSCPDKTDEDVSRYGDYPSPADIINSVGLTK